MKNLRIHFIMWSLSFLLLALSAPASGDAAQATCANCNGTGRAACEACKGAGTVTKWVNCDTCNGTGQMECSRCGGRKKEPCFACGRTGEIVCEVCRGAKVLKVRSDKEALEICPGCNGTGKTPCRDCGGEGYVTCSRCSGKGTEDCLMCGGAKGRKWKLPCNVCDGTKRVTCPVCKGRKMVEEKMNKKKVQKPKSKESDIFGRESGEQEAVEQ